MCCFAVLRSENTPMRWSHARYLPGDFDAFDAFDEAGNPPVHLWTRYLRVDVPINWFAIFEEARRKQREWTAQVLGHQPTPMHHIPITSAHTVATGTAAHGLSNNSSNNMMVGAGYPIINKTYNNNNNNNNVIDNTMDDDFTDHEAYSAVASQSLRSTRLSSISSLPLDSRPVGVSLSENYSPPQSPTSEQNLSLDNTVNRIRSSSVSSSTNKNNQDDKEKPSTSLSNEENLNHLQPLPSTTTTIPTTNIAEKKSNTSSSTTVLQNQTPITPSQKLNMALEDISFPHDSDQFSIHSDYQLDTKKQQPSDQLSQQSNKSTSSSIWRKSSFKKMLKRHSNPPSNK
ncbi:unnamed protein product [Cunninghamella blakesleeana]